MTAIQTLEEAKEIIALQSQLINTLQNRLHNLDQKRNRWHRKFDERGKYVKRMTKLLEQADVLHANEETSPSDWEIWLEQAWQVRLEISRFNISSDTIVDDENTEALSPSRTTEYS